MTHVEFRYSVQLISKVVKANRDVGPHMNPATLRLMKFLEMKPSDFQSSKVEKDPKEFLDELVRFLISWG